MGEVHVDNKVVVPEAPLTDTETVISNKHNPVKETEELKKKIIATPGFINTEEVHVDNKAVILEAPLTDTNIDTVVPNKNNDVMDINMDMNMNSAVVAKTSIEPIKGEQ